jgi:magnesium-transporting ATPase (P-type)
METAISIAHTCRLLGPSMALLRVREEDLRSGRGPPEISDLGAASGAPPAAASAARRGASALARRLSRLLGLDDGGGAAPGAAAASYGSGDAVACSLIALTAAAAPGRLPTAAGGGPASGVGLVIDGAALALALTPAHEGAFLELCRACGAVVCCRVSPMQKAQVGAVGGACAASAARWLAAAAPPIQWGLGEKDFA